MTTFEKSGSLKSDIIVLATGITVYLISGTFLDLQRPASGSTDLFEAGHENMTRQQTAFYQPLAYIKELTCCKQKSGP